VKRLTDNVVDRLRSDMREPDLSGSRYRLVRYLSRGGMGSVWLVEDTLLQRQLALKVLDFGGPGEDFADLLQEARVLAGLEHPGIVPVHDAGTLADGRAFYCMKYVEGQTLARHIEGKSLAERMRLFERIAEPVDFAHARGFIHRDLKPENIMIGAFGEVLVMDWGLAKVDAAALPSENNEVSTQPAPAGMSSRGSARGRVLGTPGYMSPEQSRSEADIDHRSDIFSLGAILWFMMGEANHDDGTKSGAPRPLRAIREKAMAEDRNARYQSAREMTADIARYFEGSPVTAYRENLLERAARIYARHDIAVILVAVYLLMRLIFILWARR
jgi:serine/threonine protein kinase